MAVAYRLVIGIIQLVFYVPSLCLAIFLATRHGFGKTAGWYFLVAFTLVRTVGGICDIIAVESPSVGVYIAALVCSSIGLAPLTLLCLGLLMRVSSNSTNPLPTKIFRYISLFSLVGLIVAIVGASRQDRSTFVAVSVRPETKAAIIMFIVVYLFTVLILCILSMRVSTVARGERRLLVAVALSAPFIAVRLVYALISDYAKLRSFSLVFGNPTILLCMSVIMEIIVTIIVIGFGLTLRVQPKVVPEGNLPQRNPEAHEMDRDFSRGQRRHIRGPVSWVYYKVKDSNRSRQTQTA